MPIGVARANIESEEIEIASQADTEPLPFENDNEEENFVLDEVVMMDSGKMKSANDGNRNEEGEAQILDGQDIEMKEADGDLVERSLEGKGAEVEEDEDADAAGSQEELNDNDELSASQVTGADVMSPNKDGQGGANFSDESDLTDEPDDDEGEEDGDEEDDTLDDAEEDGDGEDDEEIDDDDEADEDEAAEGLAALTGVESSANDIEGSGTDTASGGLDGLAVIAAAAEAEAEDESSQAEDDTDNDSIAGSQTRKKRRKIQSAIPRRTTTRLNEMMVASPAMSEDEADEVDEEEEEEEEEAESNRTSPIKTNREMSSLLGLSTAAKRNCKPGATGGLLAGAPSIIIDGAVSAVPSTATSRAGSIKVDEDDDEANADTLEDEDGKIEEEDAEGEEAGTPVQEVDEVGPEEDPSTDEAALRRQEAMEALTKIEIGFAHLRDKLYIERMNEVSKEGEMILEGTHPYLIHLSNLIELRREKKLKLVEKWFEQQEKQYERVAMTEEAAAWNNWRNQVVELRRQELFNAARKRRKLDREKRTLDVPRPIKRHQIFETELIRNPEYDRKWQQSQQNNKKSKGRLRQEGDEMAAYVAFPDLRSADEAEAWMDMERMGIAGGDPRLMHGMGPSGPFYRSDEIGIDPYAMYAIEQQQQQQQQQQQPSGPTPSAAIPSSAFATYGPPQASEFPPYERSYDVRAGQSQQGQAIDNYGIPLSPPPLQHKKQPSTNGDSGFSNTASHQIGGHGGPEPYPTVEHPPPAHAKASRRTPPPASAMTQGERDRESKGLNVARAVGGGGGIHSSPPPSMSRPGDHTGNASRAPSSQYAKYDDGSYRSIDSHTNIARAPPQGTAGGVNSANIHPKVENASSMEMGSTYHNHRHQEHLYSR